MRLLDRDRRPVVFAPYAGKVARTDSQGRLVGGWEVSYGPQRVVLASVSSTRGEVDNRVFGRDEQYDRTLLLDLVDRDEDVGFDEQAVFWLEGVDGSQEGEDGDGNPVYAEGPFQYTVRRVARTPTTMAVALVKAGS